MSKNRGFTLIELMVVLAVIALLLAIAVPAYREQVRKSRRAEAVAALGQWQLGLERWRADRPSYANPDGLAGYPVAPPAQWYTFTIPAAGPTGFTIRAAPVGDQTEDKCGTFQLVMAGGVITKTADESGCW